MQIRLLLALIGLSRVALGLVPTVAAKVNGRAITTEQVKALQKPGEEPQSAVERAVLFHIAVEQAKKEKLDQDPAVQFEIDRVLYKAYLEKQLKEKNQVLAPSETQLQELYMDEPMVRIRHLFLPAKTAEQKATSLKEAKKILDQVKKGKSFESLVLKHSQDPSAKWGGDSDYRGPNTMPGIFYQTARALKTGELSAPIETTDGVHLVQLMDVQTFARIPATYRMWLSENWEKRREQELLIKKLGTLLENAKIEMASTEEAKQ